VRPYLQKITKAKRARDVAQVVKHLSSKCKALNSNPNTTRERKRGREGEKERPGQFTVMSGS
jgi:hypothetical protein